MSSSAGARALTCLALALLLPTTLAACSAADHAAKAAGTDPAPAAAKPLETLASPLCTTTGTDAAAVHLSVPAGFVRDSVQGPKSQAALRYDRAPRSPRWSTVAVYPWSEDETASDREVLDQLVARFGKDTGLVAGSGRATHGTVALADGTDAPSWSLSPSKAAAGSSAPSTYSMWLYTAGSQRYGVGIQAPPGGSGAAVRKAVLSSIGSGACG
ncbi:hypothetical protein [Angustibacter luteus]|uniref:DUF3558 domain-containing protein n=1 Tax=Angustibacter luteus TaxID=658456 RepID=A0ABW1JBA3_9ACTN